jgi:hypothetical protein
MDTDVLSLIDRSSAYSSWSQRWIDDDGDGSVCDPVSRQLLPARALVSCVPALDRLQIVRKISLAFGRVP